MLVAYLALFPAAFAVIVARLHSVFGSRGLLLAPAIWVTTELGRQYVWDGFPWGFSATARSRCCRLRRSHRVVGVYGLSALLALVATAAALLVVDRGRTRWVVAGDCCALRRRSSCAVGHARLRSSALLTRGQPVRVAVLQGNVAQEQKWDPAKREAITERYLDMTRQALAQGATFIMWPESSTRFYSSRTSSAARRSGAWRSKSQATLLIGSDQVEPVRSSRDDRCAGSRATTTPPSW